MDECAIVPSVCPSGTYCSNNLGSYTCSICPPGFTVSSSGCIGTLLIPLLIIINQIDTNNNCQWVDIDECQLVNRQCDYHVNCTNTNGSFVCGDCPEGMEGNGSIECKSMNLLLLLHIINV